MTSNPRFFTARYVEASSLDSALDLRNKIGEAHLPKTILFDSFSLPRAMGSSLGVFESVYTERIIYLAGDIQAFVSSESLRRLKDDDSLTELIREEQEHDYFHLPLPPKCQQSI